MHAKTELKLQVAIQPGDKQWVIETPPSFWQRDETTGNPTPFVAANNLVIAVIDTSARTNHDAYLPDKSDDYIVGAVTMPNTRLNPVWRQVWGGQTSAYFGVRDPRTCPVREMPYRWEGNCLKPGFHYPSWRPELTGNRFPLPVNTGRVDYPSTRLVETRARQHGPCWQVMETGHTRQLGPLTRAVNLLG